MNAEQWLDAILIIFGPPEDLGPGELRNEVSTALKLPAMAIAGDSEGPDRANAE
jgi:hypothetical protein